LTDHISLAPRTEDALSMVSTGTQTRPGLPVDLLQNVSKRLQFLCLLILAVAVISPIVTQLAGVSTNTPVRFGSMAFVWLVSLVVYFIARSGKLSSVRLLQLGLVYEVLLALAISLSLAEPNWFSGPTSGLRWSGVAVLIIIYPVIVPNTMRATFVASLGAAASEPTVVIALSLAGMGALPPPGQFFGYLWPNIVAVGFAVAITKVIYGLGEQLQKARSMGSYHLEDLLGKGGMGEVWKATHRFLARAAAVKLIKPDALGAKDEAAAQVTLRRFEREAQTTASLRSPHTIELYDFGVSRDGTFYYVMELLDGLDLQTLVDKHGPQPPERVVFLLRQACHSLHEAHKEGLVHRDIKPANIFMCRYGTDLDFVKVLDFGIVKREQMAGKDEAQLTAVGMISGTPAYLAPEMALAEGPTDGRADLYALGCVGYWLLTGQLVFDKANPMAMVVAHSTEAPAPISGRSEIEVPEELERIIMRCLEKDPNDRPPNARALSHMLAELGLEERWTDERRAKWWDLSGPPPHV
jgi:serine/threonine-protein kinase